MRIRKEKPVNLLYKVMKTHHCWKSYPRYDFIRDILVVSLRQESSKIVNMQQGISVFLFFFIAHAFENSFCFKVFFQLAINEFYWD
jgi:hypothetical protein